MQWPILLHRNFAAASSFVISTAIIVVSATNAVIVVRMI